MDDRSPLQVGERWVNPLPDETSRRSGKNTVYPALIEPPLIELPALIEPNLDAQAKLAGLATLSTNVNLEMEDSNRLILNEFLGTKYQ